MRCVLINAVSKKPSTLFMCNISYFKSDSLMGIGVHFVAHGYFISVSLALVLSCSLFLYRHKNEKWNDGDDDECECVHKKKNFHPNSKCFVHIHSNSKSDERNPTNSLKYILTLAPNKSQRKILLYSWAWIVFFSVYSYAHLSKITWTWTVFAFRMFFLFRFIFACEFFFICAMKLVHVCVWVYVIRSIHAPNNQSTFRQIEMDAPGVT